MVLVLLAVISLLGSAGVVEWFRRRDQQKSIKSDLEVWEKLPDGQVKDRLIARIERRITELGHPGSQSTLVRSTWIVPGLGALAVLAIADAMHFLGGSYVLRRHSTDGLMWVDTPQGPYRTLEGMVVYDLLLATGLTFTMTVALPWIFDRVEAFIRRDSKVQDETLKSNSRPASPEAATEAEAQS